MVVEIYSFEAGLRFIDKYEYKSKYLLEAELFLRKLRGDMVGYKIYDISMKEFNSLSLTKRNNLPNRQWFDKGAYINELSKNTKLP